MMFENFTDRARKAMALANQEAQRLNHEYVSAEHLMLGLVREGTGVAAQVLIAFDVTLNKARSVVDRGPDMVTMGKLPQTPHAKRAIERAAEEANNMGHNWVGTEHLLLGALYHEDSPARKMLADMGVSHGDVRAALLTGLNVRQASTVVSNHEHAMPARNLAPEEISPRIQVRQRTVYDIAINGKEHIGFELVHSEGGRMEFRRGEEAIVVDARPRLIDASASILR